MSNLFLYFLKPALNSFKFSSNNHTVNNIRNIILNSIFQINLHWVKAQVGNFYNQKVDTLAKEATIKSDIDTYLGYTKIQ